MENESVFDQVYKNQARDYVTDKLDKYEYSFHQLDWDDLKEAYAQGYVDCSNTSIDQSKVQSTLRLSTPIYTVKDIARKLCYTTLFRNLESEKSMNYFSNKEEEYEWTVKWLEEHIGNDTVTSKDNMAIEVNDHIEPLDENQLNRLFFLTWSWSVDSRWHTKLEYIKEYWSDENISKPFWKYGDIPPCVSDEQLERFLYLESIYHLNTSLFGVSTLEDFIVKNW